MKQSSQSTILLCWFLLMGSIIQACYCFVPKSNVHAVRSATGTSTSASSRRTNTILLSSFAMDGSEYSGAGDNKFEDDGSQDELNNANMYRESGEEEDDEPTIECKPVPMSKNAGNRFVAIFFDQKLDKHDRDVLDLHHDRIQHTEDHVMYCRKKNLYNETFNSDSMVDILWSRQLLSSDLKRVVGSAMCIESTAVNYALDFLKEEPVLQSLLDEADNIDISQKIQLYRWRHIRDYTLRQDDGRFGFPCMLLAIDQEEEIGGDSNLDIRNEVADELLEHLITSERVIACGPLHLLTEFKDDPSSIPVGDLIMFNAKNREAAIEFAQNLPTAKKGLYGSMRLHFYNTLDTTGKFVSEDPLRDAPGKQMKEAMEIWGYPVNDDQTPWLNW